jgi:multiple sugar transport system permease protein
MIYPLGYELYISFFDWKIMPGQHSEFVALDNYRDVLEDKYFWLALKNTARYTAITVIGQMVIGLGLAVLVHRVFIGKRLFRAIYYVPVITSWVVVSFLFQFLFSSHPGGFVNYMLVSVFGILNEPVLWMSETRTAWLIIYALGIWKGVGWTMVIFLAALQGVPVELYEVAAIDGAGEWRQFWNVTVPLIRRTTLFIMVALVIGGFQAFISIYLITGGGPLHRTEVVLSYMYDRAFDKLEFGYGASLSYILAAIVVFVSFAQMRLFSRPETD